MAKSFDEIAGQVLEAKKKLKKGDRPWEKKPVAEGQFDTYQPTIDTSTVAFDASVKELKAARPGAKITATGKAKNGKPIAYAKKTEGGWKIYNQRAWSDDGKYGVSQTVLSDRVQKELTKLVREYQASARGQAGAAARAAKNPPKGPGYTNFAKAFRAGWDAANGITSAGTSLQRPSRDDVEKHLEQAWQAGAEDRKPWYMKEPKDRTWGKNF